MGQPLTPAHERLLTILRGLRESAGLSTYELAERLTWSQSRVTQVENARTRPTAADVAAWAAATEATTAVRDELERLAYEAATETRSWHISHRAGLAARQREMAGLDRSATEILHFQPSVIPGLLQAEGYARRVLTIGDVTGRGGIDAALRERMKRQAILAEDGRRFGYVLTEGALRWRPGPKTMMERQFRHLLAAVKLPAVTFSVIPFDREARAAYLHGFAIFRIPAGPVVLTEGYTEEKTFADAPTVEAYGRIFTLLSESALIGAEAVDFARAVMLG